MRTKSVITGATKGIGRALAVAFARYGSDLLLAARTEKDLQELKETLTGMNPGIKIDICPTDFSTMEGWKSFSEMVHLSTQSVNVLINNAGVFALSPYMEEQENLIQHMMQVNFFTPYQLTRALLPLMPEGDSHIFNISSVVVMKPDKHRMAYVCSKFAMQGFSRALRNEIMDRRIKVTDVVPGATWSHSWAGADFPKARLLQADEVAQAILNAYTLPANAVVEELVIRPMMGDL